MTRDLLEKGVNKFCQLVFDIDFNFFSQGNHPNSGYITVLHELLCKCRVPLFKAEKLETLPLYIPACFYLYKSLITDVQKGKIVVYYVKMSNVDVLMFRYFLCWGCL